MMKKLIYSICYLLLHITLVTANVWAQSTESYQYDALGRLIRATKPDGKISDYRYDAAGNILSVRDGQVLPMPSSSSLVPSSGVVGTLVTITGNNLNVSPSQTQVRLSGTLILLESISQTQITFRVPALASTGAVLISTPAGSANAGNFTVNTTLGLPTISSISPILVNAGQSVTLVGTQFAPLVSGNSIKVNGVSALVNAASPNSLTFTVPSLATSGKVSLTTAGGMVVSTEDLFVVPAGEQIGNILFAERLVMDAAPISSDFGATAKSGIFIFDANMGDQLSLYVDPRDNTTTISLTLALNGPTGEVIIPSRGITTYYGLSAAHNEIATAQLEALPATGTYTLWVSDVSKRLRLGVARDVIKNYSFIDLVDEVVELDRKGFRIDKTIDLIRTQLKFNFRGRKDALQPNAFVSPSWFLYKKIKNSTEFIKLNPLYQTLSGAQTLVADFTGLLQVQFNKDYSLGAADYRMERMDIHYPMVINAPFVNIPSLNNIQKISHLTFECNLNQVLRIEIPYEQYSRQAVRYYGVNGAEINLQAFSYDRGYIPYICNQTGTHHIEFSNQDNTVNVRITDQALPMAKNGLITIEGNTVTESVSYGQELALSFNATTGDYLTLDINQTGAAGVSLRLLDPQGSVVHQLNTNGLRQLVPLPQLMATGDYQIVVGGLNGMSAQFVAKLLNDKLNLDTAPMDIETGRAIGQRRFVFHVPANADYRLAFVGRTSQGDPSISGAVRTLNVAQNPNLWRILGTATPSLATVMMNSSQSETLSVHLMSTQNHSLVLDAPEKEINFPVGHLAKIVLIIPANTAAAFKINGIVPESLGYKSVYLDSDFISTTSYIKTFSAQSLTRTITLMLDVQLTIQNLRLSAIGLTNSNLTATINGPTVNFNTPTTLTESQISFTASSGTEIEIGHDTFNFDTTNISIIAPDGTTVFGPSYVPKAFSFTPTQSGNYLLKYVSTATSFFEPQIANVTLSTPLEQTLTIDAPVSTINITRPGQGIKANFTAASGEVLGLIGPIAPAWDITSTLTAPSLIIINTPENFISEAGVYQLRIKHRGGSGSITGAVDLGVKRFIAQGIPQLVYGVTTTHIINTAGVVTSFDIVGLTEKDIFTQIRANLSWSDNNLGCMSFVIQAVNNDLSAPGGEVIIKSTTLSLPNCAAVSDSVYLFGSNASAYIPADKYRLVVTPPAGQTGFINLSIIPELR